MSKTTGIRRIAMLLVLGSLALGLWCLAAWAQVKPPTPKKEDRPDVAQAVPATAQTNYLGVRRCKLCHDRDPKRLVVIIRRAASNRAQETEEQQQFSRIVRAAMVRVL